MSLYKIVWEILVRQLRESLVDVKVRENRRLDWVFWVVCSGSSTPQSRPCSKWLSPFSVLKEWLGWQRLCQWWRSEISSYHMIVEGGGTFLRRRFLNLNCKLWSASINKEIMYKKKKPVESENKLGFFSNYAWFSYTNVTDLDTDSIYPAYLLYVCFKAKRKTS